MPWKETTTMEQKVEFICEWRTGKYSITELCKAFNISRPTAYKFIARFEKDGIEGLKGQSTVPKKHPNSTKDEVVKNIIQLKEKHRLWGAKKIRRLLFNVCPEKDIPSIVTVHNILLKHGFVNLKNDVKESSQSSLFSTQKSVMKFGVQTTKESS
jgi:transposase